MAKVKVIQVLNDRRAVFCKYIFHSSSINLGVTSCSLLAGDVFRCLSGLSCIVQKVHMNTDKDISYEVTFRSVIAFCDYTSIVKKKSHLTRILQKQTYLHFSVANKNRISVNNFS